MNRISRRRFVKLAAGSAAVAPFINLGSYQLFAASDRVYSDRAITLVNDSLVMDMLSLLDMTKLFTAMASGEDPVKFSREELLANYKASYAFRERLDIDGLNHPKKMYDLTEALIQRGYSDDNIKAILGGNFRRVLGEIWIS